MGSNKILVHTLSVFFPSFLVSFPLAQSAFAASPLTPYIWSASKGFAPAKTCKPGAQEDVDFRIRLSSTSSHRSEIHAKNEKAISSANEFKVENSALPQRRLVTANRFQKKLPNLINADDFVFEIARNSVVRVFEGTAMNVLPETQKKVVGSFWQIRLTEDDQFEVLYCGTNKSTFVLFDVFTSDSFDPIAKIGVDQRDVTLFERALIRTPREAEMALRALSANVPNFNETNSESSAGPDGIEKSKLPSTDNTPSKNSPQTLKSEELKPDPAQPTRSNSGTNDKLSGSKGSATEVWTAKNQMEKQPTPILSGSLEYIICTASSSASVLTSELNQVLFLANSGEAVIPVQSFENSAKTRFVDDKQIKFVKIQFPNRNDFPNVGFVPENLVQLKSSCQQSIPSSPSSKIQPPAHHLEPISGLEDERCCNFPTKGRPLESYAEGGLRFRAHRDRGSRIHAACDIYRPKGEEVSAVAPGKVLRGKYYFYQGTYAIEVVHPGGFIVRYGEIHGRSAPNVETGKIVETGQTIGYVAKVSSGCCDPMLHFELYSGKATGSLTQMRIRGFERRKDLLDPTPYLKKWEQTKFGENY